MKNLSDQIRIGTCSWKYDSWKGLVYSDDVGKEYLSEYSKRYPVVEIDQWFWSLFGNSVVMPKPETVAEYVGSVPGEFKFSIKVPNVITLTHQYQKGKKGPLEPNPLFLSENLFDDFLALLSPMADQIDSLIFQFEYLNKQKMPGGQRQFLNQIQQFFENAPHGYRYCIETRNQNFLNPRYFQHLQSLGLTHTFLQGYWMPPIFDLYQKHKEHIQDFSLIRLHGPDRKGIEAKTDKKWDQLVEPKDSELQQISEMIRDLLSRGTEVTVNVNNHYEGSAPKTINRLLDLL